MNPAFDMPYLPNPFAAPAEEPAPAPKLIMCENEDGNQRINWKAMTVAYTREQIQSLMGRAPIPYMDTITIDQRPKRSQVALLEKLCMEKDQRIAGLELENKFLLIRLEESKQREAKTPRHIADPMGYLYDKAQAQTQLNGAKSGMLNNIQRATLPPEAAPQLTGIAAGSQAFLSDMKVTNVRAQMFDCDLSIGIAFTFNNGMSHAIKVPARAPMEVWVKAIQEMQAWADRYPFIGVGE